MTKIVPGSVVVCVDSLQVPELKAGTRYLVEKVRITEHLTMIVLKGSNCSYNIERFELETDPDIIRGFMDGVSIGRALVKSDLISLLNQIN